MNYDSLNKAGINAQVGVKRFAGNEGLYVKYLAKFPQDEIFLKLEEQWGQENYQEVFTLAHSLKGMAGNLSLESFLTKLNEFVECLRNGKNLSQAKELYPVLVEEYQKVLTAIDEGLK